MSTQHTPGPWRAVPHNPYETLSSPYVDGPGELAICTVYRGGYGETTPEAEANARLIAAAPELLQVLAELLEYTGRAVEGDDPQLAGMESRGHALLVRVQGED